MGGLNPWRRGVLVIDESSACEQAIRFCAAAPGRLASEVTILHIAQPAGGPAGVDTARGRRLAAAAACRMARAGVLPRSHVSIAAGRDVPLAIADPCTSADLVIIGVGRGGPAVAFAGALGDDVIARCGCPVLAVPDVLIREPGVIPRILLAVGDRASPAAVGTAAAAAKAFDAKILVWHAASGRRMPRLWARAQCEQEPVETVCQLLGGRALGVGTAVVEVAPPIPERLADAASACGADLVVMGSRLQPRPGWSATGGVGRRVRRVTSLPVLVARQGLTTPEASLARSNPASFGAGPSRPPN